MQQMELLEHIENKERIDVLSDRLKSLVNSKSLNQRLEAGAIIHEIKSNKLFKQRYNHFKTYCDRALMTKSSRIDYILSFYKVYNEIKEYINPLPITIEQVKIFFNSDRDTSLKFWELALIRFNYQLELIREDELFLLKRWLLGLESLKIYPNDNRNFLIKIIKLESEKLNNMNSEVRELNKESLDLELKLNKIQSEESKNKSEIVRLNREVEHYKNLYLLESSINTLNSMRYEKPLSAKSDYQVLGLNQNCTKSDIKKAFRTLSQEYHPDRINQFNLSSIQTKLFSDKFKEIKQSYDNLIKVYN